MSGRKTENQSKEPTKTKTNQMPTLEMQFVSTSKGDLQANTSSNKTQNKDLCHKRKPRKSTGEKKQSTEEDIADEDFELLFFFFL